jgi:hypothetical protein
MERLRRMFRTNRDSTYILYVVCGPPQFAGPFEMALRTVKIRKLGLGYNTYDKSMGCDIPQGPTEKCTIGAASTIPPYQYL